MSTRILYCEAGDHKWEAPVKRGRKPRNCPEHAFVATPSSVASPALNNQETIVRRVIEKALNNWPSDCSCPVTLETTRAELDKLGGGCRDPWFVCPNLDGIRRAIGFRPEKVYAE